LPEFVAPVAGAELEFAMLPFDQPLYLTLAATGTGREYLVHGAGGTLIQHLKELVLHADLKREDKIFFHADNDSMAWYWLASSLVVGATLVLHAGEELAADQPALWDLVDDYGVSVLGVHSRWLDAAARAGLQPRESHRLLGLKTLLVAGAALAPESYDYVFRDIKERVLLVPISTSADTLACFALGAPVLPVWRGEIPCRGLAMKVEVLDGSGAAVVGELGDLVCSAPFPSTPLGFWDDAGHQRYAQAYFSRQPGHWCSGEQATLTARESIILAR
jgi:acetoacetyl-CoA synthetase